MTTEEERDREGAIGAYKNLLKDFAADTGFVPTYEQWARYFVKKVGTDFEFFEHLTKEAGGYDSVLSQIFRPQGGSENFTNLRSPGTPPAKFPATPGNSGTSGVHRTQHGTSQESVEQFTNRALDVSGEYSQEDTRGDKDSGDVSVGSTTQHPAYNSGRRNITGVGYEPYKDSPMRAGLKSWEKQRGTPESTTPSSQPMFQTEEDEEDEAVGIEGEPAESGIGMTTKPEFEAQVARREAQKPTLVRRDVKGTGSRDVRRRFHDTYTGEQ